MKAIVYTRPRTLELLDVPDPQGAEGEVTVVVRSVGICGSELHGIASEDPFRKPPLIMGHEFAGTRADTGERVIVNPLISCLNCSLCLRGDFNLCEKRAIIGIHRPGGYAEKVTVPERNVIPMPEGMAWETGALVEPLANAVHAWRLPVGRNPQRVGIIGAGTIGLVSLLVARAHGIPDVEICDLATERVDLARQLGATNGGTTLSGEFDVVIDAVGAAATRRLSVERLRRGGTAVWLGLHDAGTGFDGLDLVRTEKRILGSFCYTDDDFRAALKLVEAVDHSWVTSMPLNRGVEIFGELMNGRTDLAKVMLTA